MAILTVRALESLSPSASYSYGLGSNDPHKEFIFSLIVYPRSDFLSHFFARYRNGVKNLTKLKDAGLRMLCLEINGREGSGQLGEHPQGVFRCGANGTKVLVPGTTNMGTELDSDPMSGREPKLNLSAAAQPRTLPGPPSLQTAPLGGGDRG